MLRQWQRGVSRGSVVLLAAGLLGGCSTLALKGSQLPPQQALNTAYTQLYRTSNYAFNGQLKLEQLEIIPLVNKTDDKKTVPGQPPAKVPLDLQHKEDAEDDFAVDSPAYNNMIEELIKATSQRYRFNYSGVVDLQHKQLEISPEFRYESRNMAGYIRMPVLLDGNDLSVYADFSAFSPWLISMANEGKYSRFQLKAKQREHMDVLTTLEMLRDVSLSIHQLGDASQFSEAALSSAERDTGAARKIQFNTPLNTFAARLAVFMDSNKARFQQQLIQGPEFDKAKLPALVDASTVKGMIQQDPVQYLDFLRKMSILSENESQLTQTILLDKRGRVLQSRWQVYFAGADGKKSKVKFKLIHQIDFGQFGSARVSYQPKPGNWLDIKESMNNTLFGTLFSKGLPGLGDKGNKKAKSEAKEKSFTE